MEILIPLLIIALLIFINGLFVASEFGIVGAPRPSVENEASKGDLSAIRVLKIIDDPRKLDHYIATAQLGITISSLGLGMYGEHVLAGWIYKGLSNVSLFPDIIHVFSHTLASAISIAILTYFHIVVGEMIPKSIALTQPQWTAKTVTPAVLVIQSMLYPLIKGLNNIGNGILRRVGIRRKAERPEHYTTPEELSLIVEESERGGLLKREAASVLRELIEFGDLTAGEAMVPRTLVVGIAKDASDLAVHRIIREQPHSRYPVYSETLDQVIGVVHIKDLLRCLPDCGPKLAGIVRPVPFVPATTHLEDVLKAMNHAHSQMAIVMDEQGGTAGVITVEDLFEEVVGDIREDLAERPEIFKDSSGRLIVVGTVRLENIGEALELELDHEEIDTVSGLILDTLGRPAAVGDVVEYLGVRFTVTATKGRGVREASIEMIESE